MPDDDSDLPPGPEVKSKTPVSAKPKPAKAAAVAMDDLDDDKPLPPAVAKKKHEHSLRLVAAARELGFTQNDLDNHDSAAIWEEIHRLKAEEAAAPKPVPAPMAVPVVDEEDIDWGEYEDELGVKKKYTAADVAAPIARALKQVAKENRELKKQVAKIDEIEKRELQRATAQRNEMVEVAFAALGKSYHPIIGDGSINELEPTSPELRRRKAIFKDAEVLWDDPPRVVAAKIKAAAAALFPQGADEETELEPKPAKKTVDKAPQPKDKMTGRFTVEDYERAKMPVPSKRSGAAEMSGAAARAQWFKDNGLDPGTDGDDDDSDLPG